MASPERKPRLAAARDATAARPVACGFCRHENPADAKYCNMCGAPLAAAPCGKCGAVNESGAGICGTCGGPLASGADDGMFLPLEAPTQPPSPRRDPGWDAPMFLLDESGPATPDATATAPAAAPVDTETPGRRTSPLVVIAVATLAALAAIAFLAYRPAPREPAPVAATPASQTGTGAERAAPARPPSATVPTAPVAPEKAAPPNEPAKAAAPAGRAASAATPVKRAVVEPAAPLPPGTPNLGPCTDTLAALGLCTPQAPSRKEP